MPRIGIAITKSTSFRGVQQEFSNVYYYEGPGFPNTTNGDALIDELTVIEKTFHSSLVTFVRGRLWSQVGSPATNNMISQKNLTGTGARAAVSSFDKERAYLFRLRAGSDSRGNPVYLRKWYHSCGTFTGAGSVSSTILENTSGFSAGDKTAMVSQMNPIGSLSTVGPWQLCAKSGRQPDAGATWTAHTYLEHRQLGDQWRSI